MPEYIVSVMPPYGDAEPFDIPEWDFDAAAATADRYRERGWEACVIDHGPDIRAMARTRDGACARARAVSCDRTGFRRRG